MSALLRNLTLVSLGMVVVVGVLAIVGSGSATAQVVADNVVQISIVQGEIKLTNRGLGMCKSPQADCPNEIVWRWIGADPNAEETEKIVISYIKGTEDAYNCFQDDAGAPKLFFELHGLQDEVGATVSADCPEKSAWLYQITCVRTDAGGEGELCTGIAPVDPGAIIG